MIKYFKEILSTITPGQRLFALVFLLIAVILISVGPKLADSLTMDNDELSAKVNQQKTEILELNTRVGELTKQVLENQRSCTNELLAKEQEILTVINSVESEMVKGHNSVVRIERNSSPRVERMMRLPENDTMPRLAYSVIEEPEKVTEVRTDNTKAITALRKLKKKISSDIEKKN